MVIFNPKSLNTLTMSLRILSLDDLYHEIKRDHHHCKVPGYHCLLGSKFGNDNLGLYRDDGLACFHGIDGPTSDKIRKDIVNVFKDLGLKIAIKNEP